MQAAQPGGALPRAALAARRIVLGPAGGDEEGAAVDHVEGDADVVEPEVDLGMVRAVRLRRRQPFEEAPGLIGEIAAGAARERDARIGGRAGVTAERAAQRIDGMAVERRAIPVRLASHG